jgi:hypothetical protein
MPCLACNCHENGKSSHEKSKTCEQLPIFMLRGAPKAHAAGAAPQSVNFGTGADSQTSGLSQSNRYQTPQDQSDIGAVNRSIRAVKTIALLQSQ